METGVLTAKEEGEARGRLVTLQESLSKSFKEQGFTLDLINGTLEEQLKLIEEANAKIAREFIVENYKDINDSKQRLLENDVLREREKLVDSKNKAIANGGSYQDKTIQEYAAEIEELDKKYGQVSKLLLQI